MEGLPVNEHDRALYISGPNLTATAVFERVDGKWKVDAVPALRELVKGVRMSELEEFLTERGFRWWWIGDR